MSTSEPATSTPNQADAHPASDTESKGYLSRLQRTASTLTSQGISYFNQTRGNTTADDPSTPKSKPQTPKADGSTNSNPTTPKEGNSTAKPTAYERFMSLGKTKKGWEVEWPPSHWGGDQDVKQDVVETIQPVEPSTAPSSSEETSQSNVPPVQDGNITPDAATLAQRIQRYLTTSPPEFLTAAGSTSQAREPSPGGEVRADNDSATPPDQASRPPLQPPPRHPALTSDPKLVSLLSSPAVMNGEGKELGKGASQSVWEALERLTAQIPWTNRAQAPKGAEAQQSPDKGKGADRLNAPSGSDKKAEESDDVLDDDESGFMVYGPLFPSTDPVAAASDVELAKSELVSVPEHHDHQGCKDKPAPPDDTSTQSTAQPAKMDLLRSKVEGMWPFTKNPSAEKPEENVEPTLSTTRVHFTPVTSEARKKRVWVPSQDKISVQVMWWGYRIYLPPPVLEVLDSKQLEGAKRAALLTTALKYALDRVPLALVPPPAQPAMRLCKAFTPYVGYVGSFAAWSWGAIKAFDKGHGVTLSATWLLSVAVIPGTWDPNEFPSLGVEDHKEDNKLEGAAEGDKNTKGVKSEKGKDTDVAASGKTK